MAYFPQAKIFSAIIFSELFKRSTATDVLSPANLMAKDLAF